LEVGRSVGRSVSADRLRQRQKQIDFGKRTAGYASYLAAVPKYDRSALLRMHLDLSDRPLDRRALRSREHPSTPNIRQPCSKRRSARLAATNDELLLID
jgi:hypothetical protein